MATQTKRRILNIPLPEKLYKEVEKLAEIEAKTKSEFVRELIRRSIDEDKRWKQIRKWGRVTAKKLGIKDERDIERIREEYWEERQKEKTLR